MNPRKTTAYWDDGRVKTVTQPGSRATDDVYDGLAEERAAWWRMASILGTVLGVVAGAAMGSKTRSDFEGAQNAVPARGSEFRGEDRDEP